MVSVWELRRDCPASGFSASAADRFGVWTRKRTCEIETWQREGGISPLPGVFQWKQRRTVLIKKDNSAHVLWKAPAVLWEQCAVRKRELGVEERSTAHSPVKYLQPLWCKETFYLCKLPDSWTHFKGSVWKFEKLKKKKKNGYGNILLNEYNKDSRRSKEGRDLQEEIEIKQRLISGWSERGKRQGKHISQEKDLRCRRRPAGWRWILWRTGDRKHISKDTRVCSPQMMERKQGTTHSERMDGKPNTENENSRARRRTSSRNRLSAGEDKSRRNTGKSATQGRKS